MIDTAANPVPSIHRWLPPERMRRYQWAKVVGGVLVGVIFSGWLFLQWSNPVMRIVAIGLILMTAWIIASSIITDLHRSRGRQLSIEDDALIIETGSETSCIALDEISRAEWHEEPPERAGLLLLDSEGESMALIDRYFLADQTEALAFVHWARERAPFNFEIRWPQK